MTFEELENSMENESFHDAQLYSINIDYEAKKISMEIDFTADVIDSTYVFRKGSLIISDFDFCIMDTPDAKYPYKEKGSLMIDAHKGQPDSKELPPYASDHFPFYFWVDEWNGFIRIAAGHLEIKWQEPSKTRAE